MLFSRVCTAHDLLGIPEQRVLLVADFEWAATILRDRISTYLRCDPARWCLPTDLRNQNLVADRNAWRYPVAVLVQTTGADSQDACLIQLLDGAFGEEDAARGLGLGLDPLHEDAIEERRNGLDGLECGRLRGPCVSRISASSQSDAPF